MKSDSLFFRDDLRVDVLYSRASSFHNGTTRYRTPSHVNKVVYIGPTTYNFIG